MTHSVYRFTTFILGWTCVSVFQMFSFWRPWGITGVSSLQISCFYKWGHRCLLNITVLETLWSNGSELCCWDCFSNLLNYISLFVSWYARITTSRESIPLSNGFVIYNLVSWWTWRILELYQILNKILSTNLCFGG